MSNPHEFEVCGLIINMNPPNTLHKLRDFFFFSKHMFLIKTTTTVKTSYVRQNNIIIIILSLTCLCKKPYHKKSSKFFKYGIEFSFTWFLRNILLKCRQPSNN